MDYIKNIEKKCAICGHQHHYQKLVENNSFGMRDLDTRPPGMMRSFDGRKMSCLWLCK